MLARFWQWSLCSDMSVMANTDLFGDEGHAVSERDPPKGFCSSRPGQPANGGSMHDIAITKLLAVAGLFGAWSNFCSNGLGGCASSLEAGPNATAVQSRVRRRRHERCYGSCPASCSPGQALLPIYTKQCTQMAAM